MKKKLKIKLGNKTITLPTTHKEIKLSTLEKVINVYSSEYENELFRNIDLISAYTALPLEEVEEMEIETLKQIIDAINNVDILGFDVNIKDKITINNIEYGCRVSKDNEYKFTVKETILFQKLFKNKEENYLAKVLAIVYHPIVDGNIQYDYSEDTINKKSLEFADLSIEHIGPFLNKLTEFFIKINA